MDYILLDTEIKHVLLSLSVAAGVSWACVRLATLCNSMSIEAVGYGAVARQLRNGNQLTRR
jgi:hypothetical protein